MRSNTKYWRSVFVLVGIVLGFMLLAAEVFAQSGGDSNPGVFPPDSTVFGKKYSEWSVEWWQFVLSIPQSDNPLLDGTGAKCVVGQHGPVWFLVGTFAPGTATRNCSIPKGKALFFPVINAVNVNTPNVCGQDANNIPADMLRTQFTTPFVDGATKLLVEVDGKPVQNLQKRFRVRSDAFEVTLPEDNIFDPVCAGGVPARTYSPAVEDGFYVMLKPLSVGNHNLRIHSENPSFSFSLDVTYNLTIVPVTLQ